MHLCRLRHIFVERGGALTELLAPVTQAHSMVMSNSGRQWDTSYDLNYKRKESQVAVDCMSVWRDAMLEKSAKKLKTVSTPAGVPVSHAAAPPVLKRACRFVCLSSDEED